MSQLRHRSFRLRAWLGPLPVSGLVVVSLLVTTLLVDERHARMTGVILASLGGLWASLAIHELGHLVAGWCVGLRFVLFIASPIVLRRTSGGMRVAASDSWLLPGMTMMVPQGMHCLRRRFLWMIAGGPLANLLVVVLVGGLLWTAVAVGETALSEVVLALPPLWRWPTVVCVTLVVQTGVASFLWLLPNLWPRVNKTGLMSDGGRIRMLLRGGGAADRWVALLMLTSSSMSGRRPREWDARWIQQATAEPGDTVDRWQACLWAYFWALDREAVEVAGQYLDQLPPLGEKLALVQSYTAAEVAFFEARYRDNPALAQERLADVGPGCEEPKLRAEAAIHLRAGRCAEAKRCGEAALLALADSTTVVEAGLSAGRQDWIRALLAEAERGG